MISNTTIFTGGDSKYWKQYGKSFVKSFKYYNSDKDIFVQIFNPDSNDIAELNSLGCKYNIETIDQSYIDTLTNTHLNIYNNNLDGDLKSKLNFGMKFSEENYGIVGLEDKMHHLITFAVYASFRFIRLAELWDGKNPVAAYDMDTVCQAKINIDNMLGTNDAGCLAVKGDRLVVSLVAFRNNNQLLSDWGNSLQQSFNNNSVYGFLDQDTFIHFAKKYNVTHIDKKFCDHTKKSNDAYVITGKGTTKWSERFQLAQRRWLT